MVLINKKNHKDNYFQNQLYYLNI